MTQTQTLGRYALKEHIATGGMAEIWVAEQSGPGGFQRELVIKRILPHLAQDQQFAEMFLDEANLAARLSHPKIAQIYDFGEVAGEYFIAMEFIDGLDVSQLLNLVRSKGEFIPFPIACKIVADVLEALDYAHEFTDKDGTPYQLVHRDISPQNVLVSNDGVVKLVDFGVAKAAANQSKTQPGGVKGKFAYMAPEQIQSRDIDRRVDLFATGMVLYEILTLARPFGDDLQAVTGIISLETPDPRVIRPDVPEALVNIVFKAMQKDPAMRYGEADIMFRDIQNSMQAVGGFVTDRDVSAYIRNLRGLPQIRTSKTNLNAPDAPRFPKQTPVPTVTTPSPTSPPTTGPTPNVAPHTEPAPPVQPVHTGGHVPHYATESVAMIDQPEQRNTGLIVIMVFIVLGVLAAIGGVVYMLAQPNPETKPEVKKVIVKEDQKVVKKHDFNVPGGKNVWITTEPHSDIYYKGEKIGASPYQDGKLKPGKYKIELRTKSGKVSKTITVENSPKPIQRFEFKLK